MYQLMTNKVRFSLLSHWAFEMAAPVPPGGGGGSPAGGPAPPPPPPPDPIGLAGPAGPPGPLGPPPAGAAIRLDPKFITHVWDNNRHEYSPNPLRLIMLSKD